MKILLAGESWISSSTHIKGFDGFGTAVYQSGAEPLIRALEPVAEVVYLPNHLAAREFPLSLEALRVYSVVILSDIGANTLLLHPDTWERGERRPNRLRLLQEYVAAGGGLVMVGGYLSFQGFEGKAGYCGTPVEAVLPVSLQPYDDRWEAPEGLTVTIHEPTHPIVAGLPAEWPYLLGVNRVQAKPGAKVLASVEVGPLLVVGAYGSGRSVAWMSDIGPHWSPPVFCNWSAYTTLWQRICRWAEGRDA
ncbi:MAG: glutamine amidotransferase [Thermaerobacter sp.]|nr:glutamine amidotransferase [Thermaerobacter sp.]